MTVRMFAAVVAVACLVGIAWAGDTTPIVPIGKSSFEFIDQQGDPTRPVTVWMFIPADCLPDCPVQYVFHGVERNGETYLDHWIALATAGRFMVVAPEFSRRHYPQDTDYNLGRVLDESDPRKWAFAVPDHLFDYLKARLQLRADTYQAFGHSAGGQFVHRWLLFQPDNHASSIIAANPGWYTMPVWDPEQTTFSFPFSLIGSPLGQQRLHEALARRFTLMLGERDTNPQHKYLNRSPGAMAQGAHRFERGQTFFAAARAAARQLGAALAWDLVIVPDAAHDNAAMAKAAVDYMSHAAAR